MKRNPLCLLAIAMLFVSACTTPARVDRQAALAERLDTILHRLDDTGAIVSARVLELPSGRELYATSNVDHPFKPASNMKLVISAAGLDHFGSDHAFKTYLAMDGDDLWLIGTGDPATGDPVLAEGRGGTTVTMLDEWADALEARGVDAIAGDLVVYEGPFEPHRVHPSWWPSDLLQWYGVEVAGLNFNDNCVDITVSPTEPGEPAAYEVMPPIANVTVVNDTKTAAADEHDVRLAKKAGGNVYVISGTVGRRQALQSKPANDPPRFFADALRTHLASRGIEVRGDIVISDEPLGDSPIPPSDKVVAVHESPMADVLARINKPSMNLFADALCKVTGQAFVEARGNEPYASWLNGSRAIHAFLDEAGIEHYDLIVADGSGLSHNNRVTIRLISDLLLHMHGHEESEAFKASLAVGGVEGTIRRRFTELPGRVRAKTGTISGVRALSGYAQADDGREYIFSIIYNRIPGSPAPYTALQDEAVRTIIHGPDWRPEAEPGS